MKPPINVITAERNISLLIQTKTKCLLGIGFVALAICR